MRSKLLRIFWKDADRRFLGASQAFLDFYGFSSVDEIIGKNDEELGWHVHPDLFMNDEYKVIHEGVTFLNVPGNCMCHGENRSILASKTPMYDVNGEIKGLLGYFIDRESVSANDERGRENSRIDLLTGLLNSRGIAEEAEAFQDEYYLRGTDFARIHIEINDFRNLNEQYGFDFGDKVLSAFGRALNEGFGIKCAIGRYAGRNFAVLQQVENREEVHDLRNKIKAIGGTVREIDGKPVTLYLSVGYALFSEYQSIEEQNKRAEMRLHADYDQSISAESRIDHALEIFYMFDDLPVPYSVLHVTHAEHSGRDNAVFFYVNHKFEELFGFTAKELLGRTVRDAFPFLGDEWYRQIKNAALDGKTVEGDFDDQLNGKRFHFTARQIIYPGYCAVTNVEMPVYRVRKRILIAGGPETDRSTFGDLLNEEYDVSYASDGAEALKMLQKDRNISLLLLDMNMPETEGREVLIHMQADQALKSVPVIVLTGDENAELECLRMGAWDFIPKQHQNGEIVKARIAKCLKLSVRN